MSFWGVLLFVVVGNLLRYVLPYVMEAGAQIGEGSKKWLAWEWKYAAAFGLGVLSIGLPCLLVEGAYAKLAEMTPVVLMGFSFGGGSAMGFVVKYIERFWKITNSV